MQNLGDQEIQAGGVKGLAKQVPLYPTSPLHLKNLMQVATQKARRVSCGEPWPGTQHQTHSLPGAGTLNPQPAARSPGAGLRRRLGVARPTAGTKGVGSGEGGGGSAGGTGAKIPFIQAGDPLGRGRGMSGVCSDHGGQRGAGHGGATSRAGAGSASASASRTPPPRALRSGGDYDPPSFPGAQTLQCGARGGPAGGRAGKRGVRRREGTCRRWRPCVLGSLGCTPPRAASAGFKGVGVQLGEGGVRLSVDFLQCC